MQRIPQPHKDTIIFVLGPPASGKGTVCRSAVGMLRSPGRVYRHLSVGDYLRDLCDPETPCEVEGLDRDKVRGYLRDNKLLPADVLIPLLKHKINFAPKMDGFTTVWLIDGFPRNMETTHVFEKEIGKPETVIILDCEREIAERRYLTRGREAMDDKQRFSKRYDEYTNNAGAIGKHYEDIAASVCANGNQGICLSQFLVALPPASSD
ncbi:P-loop containing nucleoside triphosphate hydrolase protein [Xylaria digitata]|nr:P-loop containing nucleoside triphosphate hydrolase protein [Xylaria digitata]